jgi:hypothetical protein
MEPEDDTGDLDYDAIVEMTKRLDPDDDADTYPPGTVIRWVASGRFDYAAMKAGNGLWYTTSRNEFGNEHVEKVYLFGDMLMMLSSDEVTDVEFALQWEKIK